MATELTTDRNSYEAKSITEMLDHGSVSFGRFAAESLAWEKWSVFSQNKCQEELEKFKAPGLVAQKKAYFEEYYKRIRALKALQAEQQESHGSETCVDVEDCCQTSKDEKNINQLHENVYVSVSEEEKHEIDASQDKFSETEPTRSRTDSPGENYKDNKDDDMSREDEHEVSVSNVVPEACLREKAPEQMISHSNSFEGWTKDEITEHTKQPISVCYNNAEMNVEKTHEVSVSTVVPEVSSKFKAPLSMDSTQNCLEDPPQDDTFLDQIKLNVKKRENIASAKKSKEAATSLRNKSRLDNRSKAIPDKLSERQNDLRKQTIHKAENSIFSRKTTIISALSNKSNCIPSQRPLTEVRPNVTVSHPPAATDKHIKLPSSSTSGITKGHVNSKDSTNKLASRLSVNARNPSHIQRSSKEIAGNACFRNTPLEGKGVHEAEIKPSKMDWKLVIPKGRIPIIQGSKSMYAKNLYQNTSNQNNGIEIGPRNSMRGGKHKLGREQIDIREVGRASKFSSSMSSSINRAQNPKPEDKKLAPSSLSQPVDLLHGRREPRRVMPVWR